MEMDKGKLILLQLLNVSFSSNDIADVKMQIRKCQVTKSQQVLPIPGTHRVYSSV
jgi:hypothetical protein